MDEFASIGHWTAGRQSAQWQKERGVVLGIGDDAAVVELPDVPQQQWQWVLAVDTMVETIHFNDKTMSASDIGYKALAANVSDVAAMGGLPMHALVSVSVPSTWGPDRMRALYDGLYECADRHGVAVIGGDTTSSPQHLVVAVTVVGRVETGKALQRSGAKPGDVIFVTGPIGQSAAGLHGLLDGQVDRIPEPLVRAHRRPAPSVLAGRLLQQRGTCTSLNDVSDGAASEAWEIAEASGVCLTLRDRQLPRSGALMSYAADAGQDALEWMLYGGEDYVLIGTIEAGDAEGAKAALEAEGIPMFIIGEVEEGGPDVQLVTSGSGSAIGSERRRQLQKRGYNHFD
ncbi:thiamine-monophosphate kinase [Paenibacillus cellulosilyticus]|uniref:Thiamine-monophosphate kinase n=1 Tax=Paenibacillus cellulosilyticus TaxID=375489 RepID=A0A2V2YNZ6_9BACL|nr:thiamine-phosphate kinase [Paenibacillus cellulosilyticus]PWV93773.1 thiamine-monophosphate kinase [Paenibacillus cellulosilyticus]QKS47395.1 thiamine-phosphate kinase [Paenibacillus cellulosilyticus]